MSGQQAGQQQRANTLAGNVANQMQNPEFNARNSTDFRQLQAIDPDRASKQMEMFQNLSKERKKAYFDDMVIGKSLLESGDMAGFGNLIEDRLTNLKRLGSEDATGTEMIKEKFNQGDIQGIIQGFDSGIKAGQQLGFLGAGERPKTAETRTAETRTATTKDWGTFQNLSQKAMETGDPLDKQKAEQYGRAARFIRETEQEKADISVSEAERKQMAKANVDRKQGFIDAGIEAANGAANVKRALTLLDEVKTGGFNNLALKAKRIFGIEGKDEGELSNLMGKAVLSQLKPIFGAAFTLPESNKLEAIEAGFGKSTESNAKLLENALEIINRAARRGMAAAEDQGDTFTFNEIKDALAFKLEDKITGNAENDEAESEASFGTLSDEDLFN